MQLKQLRRPEYGGRCVVGAELSLRLNGREDGVSTSILSVEGRVAGFEGRKGDGREAEQAEQAEQAKQEAEGAERGQTGQDRGRRGAGQRLAHIVNSF